MSWVTIVMLVTIGLVNVVGRIVAAKKKFAAPGDPGSDAISPASGRGLAAVERRLEGVAEAYERSRVPAPPVPAPAQEGRAAVAKAVRATAKSPQPKVKAAATPAGVPAPRVSVRRKPWNASRMRQGLVSSIILSPPPSMPR